MPRGRAGPGTWWLGCPAGAGHMARPCSTGLPRGGSPRAQALPGGYVGTGAAPLRPRPRRAVGWGCQCSCCAVQPRPPHRGRPGCTGLQPTCHGRQPLRPRPRHACGLPRPCLCELGACCHPTAPRSGGCGAGQQCPAAGQPHGARWAAPQQLSPRPRRPPACRGRGLAAVVGRPAAPTAPRSGGWGLQALPMPHSGASTAAPWAQAAGL